MLVDSTIANEFLAPYKAVLTEANGNEIPRDRNHYVECRELLFANLAAIAEFTSISEDFKNALSRSVHGKFIFLKKYKSWYAFQHMETDQYFAALGLTSPIEEMVTNFSVIETALIPFRGQIVCDGLIINKKILLGKNMTNNCRDGYNQAKISGDLIQEL